MILFAVIDRDLARGDEANMLVVVCKTREIAERIKQDIDQNRIEDGSRIDGVNTFVEEIEYLDN